MVAPACFSRPVGFAVRLTLSGRSDIFAGVFEKIEENFKYAVFRSASASQESRGARPVATYFELDQQGHGAAPVSAVAVSRFVRRGSQGVVFRECNGRQGAPLRHARGGRRVGRKAGDLLSRHGVQQRRRNGRALEESLGGAG